MKAIIKYGAAFSMLVPSAAWAAGFQVNEHSAAATGRGGAVVATTNDPSAVFYNPAGLTNIDGTGVEVGIALIRPHGEYKGPGLESTREPGVTVVDQGTDGAFIPVPNGYITRQLSQKAWVGFGLYAPYGLKLNWGGTAESGPLGEKFVGRTVVQEISLTSIFLTPAIALKLSDQVSVAVSVSLVPANIYLRRTLGAADNNQVLFPVSQFGSEGTLELTGSAFGVGANAGIQASLIDHLKLGFSFRSAVGLDFTGHAHFTTPETAPASIRSSFPDQNIDTELTLPHSFSLGAGWVDGPLTVEVTGNLTLWSAFNELRVNFVTGKPAPSIAATENWHAAPTLRLGGEWRINELAAVRLGVGYDWTPIPDERLDPTLPDANRFLISGGVGGKLGPVQVDLAYLGVFLADRSGSSLNFAPGTDGTFLGGINHVISLSAGARL